MLQGGGLDAAAVRPPACVHPTRRQSQLARSVPTVCVVAASGPGPLHRGSAHRWYPPNASAARHGFWGRLQTACPGLSKTAPAKPAP